ncbi:MAG: hypothetical protein H0W86_05845 [Armatimonadetes bacterium]|nr:hypothetical protein [Armatimonadota bacterium]
MSDTPEQGVERVEEKKPTDWGKKGFQWLAILLGIGILILGSQLYFGLSNARREGAANSAAAFATAIVPLLDLRNKGQLLDGESLQRVVDDMVRVKGFTLCAITDTRGAVLASSDRNHMAGSKFPDIDPTKPDEYRKDGGWEIVRPIAYGEVKYGAVVLQAQ